MQNTGETIMEDMEGIVALILDVLLFVKARRQILFLVEA